MVWARRGRCDRDSERAGVLTYTRHACTVYASYKSCYAAARKNLDDEKGYKTSIGAKKAAHEQI